MLLAVAEMIAAVVNELVWVVISEHWWRKALIAVVVAAAEACRHLTMTCGV